VEVEMPPVVSSHLIIELGGGGRILLSESAHVTWLAHLLASIAAIGEGGRP